MAEQQKTPPDPMEELNKKLEEAAWKAARLGIWPPMMPEQYQPTLMPPPPKPLIPMGNNALLEAYLRALMARR